MAYGPGLTSNSRCGESLPCQCNNSDNDVFAEGSVGATGWAHSAQLSARGLDILSVTRQGERLLLLGPTVRLKLILLWLFV